MFERMQEISDDIRSHREMKRVQRKNPANPSGGNTSSKRKPLILSVAAVVVLVIGLALIANPSSDQIFSSQTEQYKPQVPEATVFDESGTKELSGFRIEAEDYDKGGENASYVDTTDGNEGRVYRNDDVDIEKTLDDDKGYNLGWMHSNEWLVYTFDVEKVGTYDIQVRIARDGTDGSSDPDFGLQIDGKDVSDKIKAPNTDGWQKWRTVSGGKAVLGAGKHKLALRVFRNGNRKNLMNVNWINFTPSETQIDYSDPEADTDVPVIPSAEDSNPSTPAFVDTETYSGSSNEQPSSVADNSQITHPAPATSPEVTGTETASEPAPTPPPLPVVYNSSEASQAKPVAFTIQAEDYELGGQETAYWDATAGNAGEAYRNDDVDIEKSLDTEDGYNVGWMYADEWMLYTIQVEGSGSYDISARVARQLWGDGSAPAEFHLEIDDQDVSGTLGVSDTGGWHEWITMDAGNVTLEAGQHRLAFRMHNNDGRTNLMNLNWIKFTPVGEDGETPAPEPETTPTPPESEPAPTPTPLPSAKVFMIEAENYDQGGQDTAYWDAVLGNEGGEYRNDDVDIEVTGDNDGGYNVGWMYADEWMLYTFEVEGPGSYDVFARVARELWQGNVPADFHIEIDGKDVSGTVSVPNTGGWQNWITIAAGAVNLDAGQHKLAFRVHSNDGNTNLMNLNWIRFAPAGTEEVAPPTPAPEPTPAPSPTPTPGPAPIPGVGSSDGVPFGERPIHNGQLRIEGENGTVIDNLFFKDMQYAYDGTNNHVGIYIVNSENITIRNVDFQNMSEPIAISGGSNIVVEYTRTDGITGPSTRHNVQTGNFLQTVNEPTNVTIRNNAILRGGDTEDIISLWSASYSTVENNYINGTGWSSASGTGIILGDGRGTGNVARGNTLYNPGQVGIAIAGGWDHLVEDNLIYGPTGINGSNTAAYCADYSNTSGMSGHEFRNNRAWYWSEIYGSVNGFWNPCGSQDNNNNWNDESVRDIVSDVVSTPAPSPTPAPAPEPAPTTEPEPAPTPDPAPTPPPSTPSGDGVGPRAVSCSGITVSPGADIQYEADRNSSGTTFCLKAGTYYGQSVVPKNGQSFIGEPGAILDGEGYEDHAFIGAADDVTISNLTITNYATPLQLGMIQPDGGDRWTITYNDISEAIGGGIHASGGDNHYIAHNYIHHNHQNGITTNFGNGVVVEYNEIAYNNYLEEVDWGWEAGGSKFWAMTNMTIRGNDSHHNEGPGLWTDNDNIYITYEDNVVHENIDAPGIFHEISQDAVIRNNYIYDNGWNDNGEDIMPDNPFWTRAGIQISASKNVDVYGNTIKDSAKGITGMDQCRGTGMYGTWELVNVRVHDNIIDNSGLSSAASDCGSTIDYEYYDNTLTGNSRY